MAENPRMVVLGNEEADQSKEFYFKRVSSKYYTEKPSTIEIAQDESRTRRWGHTRIAYEKSKNLETSSFGTKNGLSNSLLIVNN